MTAHLTFSPYAIELEHTPTTSSDRCASSTPSILFEFLFLGRVRLRPHSSPPVALTSNLRREPASYIVFNANKTPFHNNSSPRNDPLMQILHHQVPDDSHINNRLQVGFELFQTHCSYELLPTRLLLTLELTQTSFCPTLFLCIMTLHSSHLRNFLLFKTAGASCRAKVCKKLSSSKSGKKWPKLAHFGKRGS